LNIDNSNYIHSYQSFWLFGYGLFFARQTSLLSPQGQLIAVKRGASSAFIHNSASALAGETREAVEKVVKESCFTGSCK